MPDRHPVVSRLKLRRVPRRPVSFTVSPVIFSPGVVATALIVLVLTSACGRQVAVDPPNPSSVSVVDQCGTLVRNLPDNVDGAGRRPTTPVNVGTAAWGEPAIVLRCGVEKPPALSPTSAVVEIAGITWFPEALSAGVLFTTVEWPSKNQPVYVEVAIPDRYESPAAIITDIGTILASY